MKKTEVIKTRSGKVQGYIDKGVNVFRGISYAEPPVGDLRFRPPVEIKPWTSILETTRFGFCSFQGYTHLEEWFGKSRVESEDCLTLNIWTPGTDDKKRPVMFWVHGGAFIVGSSKDPFYDGSFLSRRGDLVVVTINYRLGALGYLYVKGEPANNGLLDQITALKWVKENIEFFGGDPNNITVFGESAGAMSVSLFPAVPATKGLFQRMILQSVPYFDPATKETISKSIISVLGMKETDFEQLKSIPPERIIDAQNKMLANSLVIALRPVIDGEIVLEHPLKVFQNGKCKDIDVMIGTNLNEGTVFTATQKFLGKKDEEHKRMVENLLLRNGIESEKLSEVMELYKTTWKVNSHFDVLNAVLGDLLFRLYSIDLLDAQSRHQVNTFNYLFTWKSPMFDGKLGSCHILELPFVFGTHEKPRMNRFVGTGSEVRKLSEKMMDAWIAFAHTGNPNHRDNLKWPPYDENKRSTMVFGEKCEIKEKIQEETRKIWENKLKY